MFSCTLMVILTVTVWKTLYIVVSFCWGACRPEGNDVYLDSTKGHTTGHSEAAKKETLHWARTLHKDCPARWSLMAFTSRWVTTLHNHILFVYSSRCYLSFTVVCHNYIGKKRQWNVSDMTLRNRKQLFSIAICGTSLWHIKQVTLTMR